ncbi:MAG: phosphatase domain-containing protein [Dermatophilaceae bacterium]
MARPHRAAVIEDAIKSRIADELTERGWQHKIIAYTGYGSAGFLRVLGRVLFTRTPDETAAADVEATDEELRHADEETRGWRAFMTAPAAGVPVTVRFSDREVTTRTDRSGLVDLTIRGHGLLPGWHHVVLESPRAVSVEAPVNVIASAQRFGIISDIDDTILTTNLPRPLVAFWNTFVREEAERRPVPGMAEMYREFIREHEVPTSIEREEMGAEVPVIYVSTGAWNTAPHLMRFITHHGFPAGPLLLTDWGPTNSGWFRSGPAHKRAQLRRIARELPHIRWVLVGDTGQQDPILYREFAEHHPDLVRAIALREMGLGEKVVSHGPRALTAASAASARGLPETPVVEAADGWELAVQLRAALGGDIDPWARYRDSDWFVESPHPVSDDH